MLTVEVTETISCTPDELLEFVMDVERYAQADRKIRPIRWARYDGNLTEFGFRPRLGGLPAPPSVAQTRLIPGERIDITLAPPPANRLPGWLRVSTLVSSALRSRAGRGWCER